MEILIELNHDEEERTLALLAGLDEAGLVTLEEALLVHTEDRLVGDLLVRYGRRLDRDVLLPVLAQAPAPVPDVLPPSDIPPLPSPADPAVPSPKPRRKPGPKPKSALPRPSATTPELARDLAAIVREAGQKAVAGVRMPKETMDMNGLTMAPNGTVYTDPLTKRQISYGEMRELLANRQVNPKERFISNRHGLMEVRDFGKKLKLVKVEDA